MMDRYCEYCVNLRSVVYCKADAAYLCLSCDAKVHTANPLSKRHHRTLICDTCRRRPTYVRCYDHQRFMCRGCDLSQHDASSQHMKRVMSSYVGSPSARDLGALWGFDLSRFGDGSSNILDPKLGSSSCPSSNTSVVSSETNVHHKEIYGGMQVVILQQLVELLKLQTTYDIDQMPSVIRCEEHNVDQSNVDQSSQQFWLGDGHPDHHEMILDPCSSPFTQLDHLESENDETDLQGDLFWQCKSRVPSGQLWSQNMQDLGVCEEPSCKDDLNIPDIDVTFRNFEELFRIEQETTRQDQGKSMTNSESSPKKARYASQIMSFSHSRLGAESSGTVWVDSGTSPSCGSLDNHEMKGNTNIDREDSKQGQCGYRKARSDTRKRTKSQSWKFESHGSVTRSL